MLPTVLAPLTLSELQARYGLKTPNSLRARIEGLGIKPQQDGRSRVVAVADILLLDELHQHLGNGGTVASFLRSKGMAIATVADSDADTITNTVSELVLSAPAAQPVQMELLLNAIAAAVQPKPSNPAERYRFLDEAVQAGWVVTTADLRWATGQRAIREGQWRGYTFKRVGRGLFQVSRYQLG